MRSAGRSWSVRFVMRRRRRPRRTRRRDGRRTGSRRRRRGNVRTRPRPPIAPVFVDGVPAAAVPPAAVFPTAFTVVLPDVFAHQSVVDAEQQVGQKRVGDGECRARSTGCCGKNRRADQEFSPRDHRVSPQNRHAVILRSTPFAVCSAALGRVTNLCCRAASVGAWAQLGRPAPARSRQLLLTGRRRAAGSKLGRFWIKARSWPGRPVGSRPSGSAECLCRDWPSTC